MFEDIWWQSVLGNKRLDCHEAPDLRDNYHQKHQIDEKVDEVGLSTVLIHPRVMLIALVLP